MGPAPARRALVDTSHESHVATGAWRAPQPGTVAHAPARPRPGAAEGRGMRRLPHGSARGGRRAAGPAVSGHARTRGDRHRRGDRRGRRPAPGRPPRRRRLAGLDLRPLRVLPDRTREPLRCGGVHRLYARRRLCVAHAGRNRICVSAAAGRSGRIHGAVDVRRPDRLARAASGWRRPPPGRVRVRLGRAGAGANLRLATSPSACLHPTRRRRRPVARAHAGRGLPATAASTRRNPWTRPSSSRPSASLYPWPCGPSARADASCAAAYT